jgi:hypothetical protein
MKKPGCYSALLTPEKRRSACAAHGVADILIGSCTFDGVLFRSLRKDSERAVIVDGRSK